MITKYSIPLKKGIANEEEYATHWLRDCLLKCKCDYQISDYSLRIEDVAEGVKRAIFELNAALPTNIEQD